MQPNLLIGTNDLKRFTPYGRFHRKMSESWAIGSETVYTDWTAAVRSGDSDGQ